MIPLRACGLNYSGVSNMLRGVISLAGDRMRVMEVSLEQAIEIHARALKRRDGRFAPRKARKIADDCRAQGDQEGHKVWLLVGEKAEALLRDANRLQA